MWVGAQAWRRARAQGDRRRLPDPVRRKTPLTAEPSTACSSRTFVSANKPELGCREEEGAADGGGTTNTFCEASAATPGDGGGFPRTHSPWTRTNPRLLMVGVPRIHSARCQFNPRSPRWSPRRSTDLESRPKRCASRMDAEHTREGRVGARGESV